MTLNAPEISWLKPGAKGASANLQSFIDTRIKGFADLSNNPNEDVCSHMSVYFNLGQMSAQAAVMRVKAFKRHPDGVKAFVEQGVVRRELSDNFCFHNGRLDVFLSCVCVADLFSGWTFVALLLLRAFVLL